MTPVDYKHMTDDRLLPTGIREPTFGFFKSSYDVTSWLRFELVQS